MTKIASPIPPTISPRSGYGRNWRVSVSISEPSGSAGLEVAGDLAQDVGHRQGEQQEAREHDQQPALDPDARAQPAAQVHARSSSRWKTATGPNPRSRSQAASSSLMTIERW